MVIIFTTLQTKGFFMLCSGEGHSLSDSWRSGAVLSCAWLREAMWIETKLPTPAQPFIFVGSRIS